MKEHFATACLLLIATSFCAETRSEDFNNTLAIARGYAVHGNIESRPTYAVTQVFAGSHRDFRGRIREGTDWRWDLRRVCEAIDIPNRKRGMSVEIQDLPEILTVESVVRAIDRYGIDAVDPRAVQYLGEQGEKYAAFFRILVKANQIIGSHLPTEMEQTIEDHYRSDFESQGADLINIAITGLQKSAIERALSNSLRSPCEARRKKVLASLYEAFSSIDDSAKANPITLGFALRYTGPGPLQTLFVRNQTPRSLPETFLFVRSKPALPSLDTREPESGLQLVRLQGQSPGEGYPLELDKPVAFRVLPVRHEIRLDVLVVDHRADPTIASLMARPGTRVNSANPSERVVILDPVTSKVQTASEREKVALAIASHNQMVEEVVRLLGEKLREARKAARTPILTKSIREMQSDLRKGDYPTDDSSTTSHMFARPGENTFQDVMEMRREIEALNRRVQNSRTAIKELIGESLLNGLSMTDKQTLMAWHKTITETKPLRNIRIKQTANPSAPSSIAQSHFDTFVNLMEQRLLEIELAETKTTEDESLDEQTSSNTDSDRKDISELQCLGICSQAVRDQHAHFFQSLLDRFRAAIGRLVEDAPHDQDLIRAVTQIEGSVESMYGSFFRGLGIAVSMK